MRVIGCFFVGREREWGGWWRVLRLREGGGNGLALLKIQTL